MTNLEQALSFANYQFTLTQQRKVLKQKFDDACVFPWNGGLFRLSLEFLGGVNTIGNPSEWIVDVNGNPIWITDVSLFYTSAYKQYSKASAEYGEEYAKLKSQRSVKALVGL